MTEAAKFMGVPSAMVQYAIKSRGLVKGKYLINKGGEPFTAEAFTKRAKIGIGCEVINVLTDEVKKFRTQKAAGRFLAVSPDECEVP